MWYRDYSLVREHVRELDRQAREGQLAASLNEARSLRQHHRRATPRMAAAAGMRRVGRALMALSERIDECQVECEAATAARHAPAH